MGITATLSTPLFTGSRQSASVVPGRFNVALGGRPYLIDTMRVESWQHRSVPLLRQQADTSTEPSEASLNPEDLWRRSFTSWHRGAGQLYVDGPTAKEEHRFLSSKGVNPWEERKLTLLKDTYLFISPVSANPVVASDWIYAANGTTIVRFDGITTQTTITGTPANNVSAMATDGTYVWSAHGASGVYQSAVSGTTTSSYATGTVTGLAFVAGRLMAWNGGALYNITAAGALPTALMDKTNWTIVGCAEGQGFIYTAAYSDNKSLIYKTTITADATALAAPSVAAALPDGEVVSAIYGYLGFIFIGTNRGVRFAFADINGNLTLGETIETSAAVECFEGEGRFVWFGWTNYDDDSTGLGRLTPAVINDGGQPAYASDLMASVSGAVKAVTTFNDRRVFWVEGEGLWAENATNYVDEGTVTSGYITYGLVDNKVVKRVDAVLSPSGNGSASVALGANGGTLTTLGTVTPTSDDGALPAARTRGRNFTLKATLTRDADDADSTPSLEWVTVRAYPAVGTTEVITVPILLFDQQAPGRTPVSEICPTPSQELANLRGLRDQAQIVSYQEGTTNYQVLVVGVDWLPEAEGRQPGEWNGTALITLKTFGGLTE